MTVCAFEPLDLERGHPAIITGLVALLAFHLDMLADKGETREIVIEQLWIPVLRDMASLAVGHSVLHEILAMHIVMTVIAGGGEIPEHPFLFRPRRLALRAIDEVTGHAWGSDMRALQWETGGSMLLQRVHAHVEAIGKEMALDAVRR